ncbi:MAG: hypothetical protein M5T61_09670 [Acidimicrobiia bacterium]|nr:hypothetical protein [Acidimicrobiia bacterium]
MSKEHQDDRVGLVGAASLVDSLDERCEGMDAVEQRLTGSPSGLLDGRKALCHSFPFLVQLT